jgi:phosphoglucomutase
LQAVAHEEATAENEDYERAAVLGNSLGFVDANLALVAIAHSYRARLFMAAGSDGIGGSLLLTSEASLAQGLNHRI